MSENKHVSKIDMRGIKSVPAPCPFKKNDRVCCGSMFYKYNNVDVQYVCMCDSCVRTMKNEGIVIHE